MNFVFAFLAHQSVPGLVNVPGDKSKAPQVFLGAMGTACTVYGFGRNSRLLLWYGPSLWNTEINYSELENYNGDEDPALAGDVFTIFVPT